MIEKKANWRSTKKQKQKNNLIETKKRENATSSDIKITLQYIGIEDK